MKKLLSILFSLLLVVTLVGCDSDDDGGDDPAATAQVRFVHASPNAGPVDVLVDGEEVASGFAFQGSATNPIPNVSSYVEVPIDVDATIEVQTANGDNVFTVNADQVNLEEGVRYTVLAAGAVGVGGGPEPILLEDRFQDLSSNQIGLRLVHGSKGVQSQVGPVDVYLTPPNTDLSQVDPLIAGFEFGDDSSPNPSRPGLFIPRELSGEFCFPFRSAATADCRSSPGSSSPVSRLTFRMDRAAFRPARSSSRSLHRATKRVLRSTRSNFERFCRCCLAWPGRKNVER